MPRMFMRFPSKLLLHQAEARRGFFRTGQPMPGWRPAQAQRFRHEANGEGEGRDDDEVDHGEDDERLDMPDGLGDAQPAPPESFQHSSPSTRLRAPRALECADAAGRRRNLPGRVSIVDLGCSRSLPCESVRLSLMTSGRPTEARRQATVTATGGAAPREHELDRLEQDPEVQPEGHVLEVVEVVADLLHFFLDGIRVAITDLRPAGDPRPHRAPER